MRPVGMNSFCYAHSVKSSLRRSRLAIDKLTPWFLTITRSRTALTVMNALCVTHDGIPNLPDFCILSANLVLEAVIWPKYQPVAYNLTKKQHACALLCTFVGKIKRGISPFLFSLWKTATVDQANLKSSRWSRFGLGFLYAQLHTTTIVDV